MAEAAKSPTMEINAPTAQMIPYTHFIISTTSHRLDTSPFIGSVFKDFLRQIYALASNMDINLMGVK